MRCLFGRERARRSIPLRYGVDGTNARGILSEELVVVVRPYLGLPSLPSHFVVAYYPDRMMITARTRTRVSMTLTGGLSDSMRSGRFSLILLNASDVSVASVRVEGHALQAQFSDAL